MAKKRASQSSLQGGFFALPKLLMEDDDFRRLSGAALKVLMVLGGQYAGNNNGNLSATHLMLKDHGGISKTTLAKALRELEERNLIMKTRDSHFGRDGARCALYALTWQSIDDCPGKALDTKPTITPPRKLTMKGKVVSISSGPENGLCRSRKWTINEKGE